MRRWFVFCCLVAAFPAAGNAQDSLPAAPPPLATLTLAEALQQAKANNPEFRQFLNDANVARMSVRNAYGALLPSFSVQAGMSYTGAGQSNFGQGFTRPTSALVGSSYSAGLTWQLDGAAITGPAQQKANQRATEEEITNQQTVLDQVVTTQYLTTLQATAQVAVARQQVERNRNFLELANAKYRVGQGTLIEVRQAEVQKAQSDVQLLRNVQLENEAKLELFRQMGVTPPVAVDRVALTDSFPVNPPSFELERLLQTAEQQNPALRSLRARERAASLEVRSAKSAFLPSLSVSAGWSGFTQQLTDKNLLLNQSLAGAQGAAASCFTNDSLRTGAGLQPVGNCYLGAGLDPTGTSLDPTVRRNILSSNSVFPFDFTGQPFGASLTISLPIFTGFGRSLRLSQARAQEQDAEESLRARGLQVQSEVHARYLALQTAYQAIGVQTKSREAARDQLRLAQDRYRLGSGTSLEVSDAQNAVQQAEGDYVNAIYDYHKALAALEAAVGRPLR